MSTRYEYYNTGDDVEEDLYGVTWFGQTFTPSVAHIITSVKLLVRRNLNPGLLTVSIRGTTSGLPSGSDKCSGTVDGNALTTNIAGEWKEITLGAGAGLLAATKYAIVVRATGGDGSNIIGWRADQSSPSYTGGLALYSGDSGASWGSDASIDFMFEEWGYLLPSGGSSVGGKIGRRLF